jgi:16S rRNA (cytidine1402-2'-O)-methyltransferase
VVCEDTRVTRKLLTAYGLARPLVTYHEHNAERVRPRLIRRMAAGEAVALVSDAGTPLVSDPGYKLVRAALEAGLSVQALPGASALRPAQRPILLRRVPAGQAGRTPGRPGRARGAPGDPDLLRVGPPPVPDLG